MRTTLPKNKIASVLIGATILISSFLAMQNSVQAASTTNGPIFVYDRWAKLINSDGTLDNAPRHLTGAPVYSHDGAKMAWVEGKNGGSYIKIANSDGTSVKTLLDSTIQFEKVQFTSTSQLILFDYYRDTLYTIDPATENQTLTTANEFLKLNSGGFADIAVSKTDKLAYVDNGACPPASAGLSLAGIFTRDITGTGPGTLVTESCTNPSTGTRRESRIVAWNTAGTKLFVGHSEYVSSTVVNQRIVEIDPAVSGSLSSLALIGAETTNQINNFEIAPQGISPSPDGTKLAVVTQKTLLTQPYLEFSLWTLNVDGTALIKSSVKPSIGAMSWARPITLDAVPTTTIAPTTTTIAATTTTTVAPTTTTTTTTTTAPLSVFASAVPGITVTDTKVYQTAPKQVAGKSAIIVLSTTENKTADVVSKTPSICLPSDNDLVFIDEGRCIAEVVNTKTRKVLRTLKTTVVSDDISELEVGNEVAILTPLYFVTGTFELKAQSLSRLTKLKDKVTAAGSVLVAGHSGVLMGNTPENVKLAKARADATVAILKARGAKGPFTVASVGALDPVSMVKTQAAQEKNRRVVIVLIP